MYALIVLQVQSYKSYMENENLISTHKQVTDYSGGHSSLLVSRYSQFVKTCFFLNFLFLAVLGKYNSRNSFCRAESL